MGLMISAPEVLPCHSGFPARLPSLYPGDICGRFRYFSFPVMLSQVFRQKKRFNLPTIHKRLLALIGIIGRISEINDVLGAGYPQTYI
jgi:hypothetical protein